jgi:hypothetical protein
MLINRRILFRLLVLYGLKSIKLTPGPLSNLRRSNSDSALSSAALTGSKPFRKVDFHYILQHYILKTNWACAGYYVWVDI